MNFYRRRKVYFSFFSLSFQVTCTHLAQHELESVVIIIIIVIIIVIR